MHSPDYVGGGIRLSRRIGGIPRLPLEGSLDLTYRCNNACRHCWVWMPADAPEGQEELSYAEVRDIVDQARAMGCRSWHICGGEPMLRPEFAEILDYLTRRCASYSLNTNGTLITPAIARLLTRKGCKMVALYGATAEVHDHITRTPGSFEATMRGFAYLKEAGAGFIVQVIPMRDNYHQWSEMLKLAQSLSPDYRVGAPWLFLSAYGSAARNREIAAQRLDPKGVIAVDPPDVFQEEGPAEDRMGGATICSDLRGNDRLFASCIASRREFHIDPFGQMTFCMYIKDPSLRYDLRRGTFHQAWEEFIPLLADRVRGGHEYMENCGSCASRGDCRWCAVYSYLEHGRLSTRVEYLCQIAQESRRFKEKWQQEHRRYYRIADITIQVDSDLPITDRTFEGKFEGFRVAGAGEDTIALHHRFFLPKLDGKDLGKQVWHSPPWAIYQRGSSWLYVGISPTGEDASWQVAEFNQEHTRATIYNGDCCTKWFQEGGLPSLTMFPTDHLFLARVLADRQACCLHAAGMVLDGKGFLFVGPTGAGKSTMVTMLQEHGEILSDDRIIIRHWPEGFRIHGTWSHGTVSTVSSASAPLQAILLLEKASDNCLVPIESRLEIAYKLLCFVVRPLVTRDWCEKTLSLLEQIVREVPVYRMRFDMSGKIVEVLKRL